MIEPPPVGLVPGWYDDPESPHRLRYFDGAAWTERTEAKNDASPSRPVGKPTWRDLDHALTSAGPHRKSLKELASDRKGEDVELVIPVSITTTYGDTVWPVIAVTSTRVISAVSGLMGLMAGTKSTPREYPHRIALHDMPGGKTAIEIDGLANDGPTPTLASAADAAALKAALESNRVVSPPISATIEDARTEMDATIADALARGYKVTRDSNGATIEWKQPLPRMQLGLLAGGILFVVLVVPGLLTIAVPVGLVIFAILFFSNRETVRFRLYIDSQFRVHQDRL